MRAFGRETSSSLQTSSRPGGVGSQGLIGVSALALWSLASLAWAQPAIQIVHPAEGAEIPLSSGTFVLGSVSPATATLTLNGQPVPVYRTGGFLAYIPIAPGSFDIVAAASTTDGARSLTRRVKVTPAPAAIPPGRLAYDPASVQPSTTIVARAGDWVSVGVRATPGCEGAFDIAGLCRRQPLLEMPAGSGVYVGAWQVQLGDEAAGAEVRMRLTHRKLGALKVTAPATVTVLRGSMAVAEVSTETVALRSGPREGYHLFLASGQRLLLSGWEGARARVWLSETDSGWLDGSAVRPLPRGTPPPSAVLGTISTREGGRTTRVTLRLSAPVPWRVETEGDRVALTLFYTRGYTNWMIYDSSDTIVREIRWKQSASQTAQVEVFLRDEVELWGYQVSTGPGALFLDVSRPPAGKGLAGRTIILDPGHGPVSSGARGPLGTPEHEVNLALARVVKARLEREGAAVVLTREEGDASLSDRAKMAVARGGDVFVSLHQNALADGQNPFEEPHGFSVFYYHPHSLALAEAIHGALKKGWPLADEGVRYGNLAVARQTAMPAVLVECAYLIFPDQEEMLLDARARTKFADVLTDGLQAFFKSLKPAGRSRR